MYTNFFTCSTFPKLLSWSKYPGNLVVLYNPKFIKILLWVLCWVVLFQQGTTTIYGQLFVDVGINYFCLICFHNMSTTKAQNRSTNIHQAKVTVYV